MAHIIQGKWEEIAARNDLQGRTVKVIVYDEGEQSDEDPWLKSLHAWVNSHGPVGHRVDDSRESIYSGTVDDPR